MKTVSKIFGVVAAIAALASCNKEIADKNEVVPEGMKKVTFTAQQGTKTEMQTNGDIYWSEKDAIGVEYIVNGFRKVYEFNIVELESGRPYENEAEFAGYVPVDAEVPADYQYAYYPYINEYPDTYNVYSIVPTTQVYKDASFATNTLPMSGSVAGNNVINFIASAAVVMVPAYTAAESRDVTLSYGPYDITMTGVHSGTNDLIFVVDGFGQSSFTVDGVVYNTGVQSGTTLKKVQAGNRYKLIKVVPQAAPEATVTAEQESDVNTESLSVDEDTKTKIEQNTDVLGVSLKTENNAGINAIINAATAKSTDFADVIADAEEVKIDVNVVVTPSDYVAPTPGTQGSVTFSLQPVATVTAGTVEVNNVPVTNDMLDNNTETMPIIVNIYTGFEPAVIVHKSAGYPDEEIKWPAISYNSTTGVTTVKISHFSSLEVYEKEVPGGITTPDEFETAVKGAASGATITLGAGTFNLNAIKVTGGKALTFVGAGTTQTILKYGSAYKQGYSDGGGVACYCFDGSGEIKIKNAKLEDYFPNDGNDYDHGFVRAGKMTFEGCEIASPAGCWGNNTKDANHLVTFKSCKFTAVSTSMYSVVTYQGYEYVFDSCEFAGNAKGAIKLYRTEDKATLYPVKVKGCKFVKGANTTKTPIYFYDSTSNGGVYAISIEGNNTQEGYGNHSTSGTWIWGDMKNDSSKSTVTVNGTLVWANGAKVN